MKIEVSKVRGHLFHDTTLRKACLDLHKQSLHREVSSIKFSDDSIAFNS
jgi:hypothetical protein